jgi:hypothetical protein
MDICVLMSVLVLGLVLCSAGPQALELVRRSGGIQRTKDLAVLQVRTPRVPLSTP